MHKLLKAPANFMVSGGESMDMTGINMAVESSSNSLTAWSMAFENLETSTMDVSMESTSTLKPSCVKRKKFVSDQSEGDDDEFKFPRSDFGDSKKQNHSEIEKRRRDKMNTYILELSSLVPMCKAMSRKLDKLTVLRMAVQHMKTLRGSIHSYTEGHYKPSFLSDEEVKRVILEAAEGFLFVVGCDRGRILFVSESVSQLLHYSQSDLLGQSWFDILHPKDVAKVKEQLSSPDLSPRERFIDAKTMLPVKTDVPHGHTRMCPGARRSFFCRVKCKTVPPLKEEADTTTGCHRRKKSPNSDRKYCVIHCTGYLKSWPPAKVGLQEDNDGDSSSCNLSCLVAVGRVQPLLPSLTSPSSSSPSTATVGKSHIPVQSIEYVSRHSVDGKFVFVDQRATLILGYLPQELLGTSCYEYYHQDDIQHLADTHKAVLQGLQQFVTQVFRFRTKDGSFLRLQTKWKAFRNPWTKDIEYLIARNTAIPTDSGQVESSISEGAQVSDSSLDSFLSTLPAGCAGGSIQRPIGSIRVGAGKIGRQIADKAQEVHRTNYSSSSSNSPVRTADPPLNGPSARRQETFSTLTLQQQPSSKQVQVPPPSPVIPVLLPPLVDVASSSSPMPPPLPNHCLRPLPPTSVPTVSLPQNNHGTFHPGIDGHFDRNLVARSTHPVNNVILDSGIQPDADVIDSLTGSHTLHAAAIQTSEGNDEAAMAVIMSLLEADAGLGGPVDFTGLPWPLP